MRGLQYLLLSAWATAVAWHPAKGEGRQQPYEFKSYGGLGSMYVEDEVNGALRKRQDVVANEYCRFWAHSSE